MTAEQINAIANLANSSWTVIIILIGIGLGLYEKIRKYISLSKDEKINLAKDALKVNVLKYMSDAEVDWSNFKKAGEIKRAQVIAKVYTDFPVLKEYVSQEDLIKYIDGLIDEYLGTVTKVVRTEIRKEDVTNVESNG